MLFCSVHIVQAQADKILGIWMVEDQDAKVEIYKKGEGYFGKLVWIKDAFDAQGLPILDDENPDKSLRSRPLMNLEFMYDFKYDPATQEYIKGKLYNTRNGKTYKGKLWLKSDNSMQLRGYWGMFYQTETWTRVKE